MGGADILCSWIRRLNIIKMSVLHNLIYRVSAILIQISLSCFIENRQIDSTVYKARQRMANGGSHVFHC